MISSMGLLIICIFLLIGAGIFLWLNAREKTRAEKGEPRLAVWRLLLASVFGLVALFSGGCALFFLPSAIKGDQYVDFTVVSILGGIPFAVAALFVWLLSADGAFARLFSSIAEGSKQAFAFALSGPPEEPVQRRVREAVVDDEVVAAFRTLTRTEGIIPALEPAHALAWVIREAPALAGRTVLINLSGRGDKDVAQIMDLLEDEI